MQTTRVRSLSGEQLIFGNADLLKSRIQNFKRMQERRVVFQIGVEYGTSPELMQAIPDMIRTLIQALPRYPRGQEEREDVAARIAGNTETNDKQEWEGATPRSRA